MAHVGAGQGDDLAAHGGGEEHRLSQLGRPGDQSLDVGQEAEVEHLVGLVQDEHLDVGQVERAAGRQVEQPTRRTDDHVDAGREHVELRLVGDPAVDRQRAGATVLAGQLEVVGDLKRELTGRRDDEGLRFAGGGQLVVVGVVRGDDALEDRDGERQRLAGTGARLTDQVGAHQRDREGHLLDGKCVGDVDVAKRVDNLGEHPEVMERSDDETRF